MKHNEYWQRLPPEIKEAFARAAFDAWIEESPISEHWQGLWDDMPTAFKDKWKAAVEAVFVKLRVKKEQS